jgi:ATP-dependent protease Clp ATPase subunit
MGVNFEKENFQNASDTINAKTSALICASIIDSMISNSATNYQKEMNCQANKNTVSSKINETTKTSFIIGNAKSDLTLKVNIIEHYK